jgi:hypothetical protein
MHPGICFDIFNRQTGMITVESLPSNEIANDPAAADSIVIEAH